MTNMKKNKKSTIKKYWGCCKKELFFFVLFSAFSVALKMCFALFVSEIIDSIPTLNTQKIAILFSFLFGFIAFRFLDSFFLNHFNFKICEKVRYEYKKEIYKKIANIPISENINIKSYENILITNVNQIIEDYYDCVLDIVDSVLTLVTAIVFLAIANIFVLLNILVFSFIQVLLVKLFKKRINSSRKNFLSESNKQYIFIGNLFSAKRLFYSHSFKKHLERKSDDISQSFSNASYKKQRSTSDLRILTFICSQFMYLSTMLIGIILASNDKMSVGQVISSCQFMNYVTSPLSIIFSDIGVLKGSGTSMNEIAKFLNTKEDQLEVFFDNNEKSFIELKNVSFSADSEKNLLENINLSIKENDKVLIIGESGSGKTTFAKLLTKEYLTTSGEITIKNQNINNISDKKLHEFISYICSEELKFEGNVLDNITIYNEAKNEEANKLIAYLELPNSENVNSLSKGELQRMQIARSLLEETPLIIADECTAHLDEENRKKVEQVLLNRKGALIMITHNYDENLMKSFNKIIRFNSGKIEIAKTC